MKKSFCCLSVLFLLAISLPMSAQTVKTINIKGAVFDENKSPMPYASVWASYASTPKSVVKGGLTTNDGGFMLTVPAGKDYILNVQFLGCKTITNNIKADSTDVDLGLLTLISDPMLIEEIVIRPPLRVTSDKIVFNFENDPTRATSNMLSMIEKMPLIYIDPFDGKIHVGSQEKTYIVLRKGRRDALFNNPNLTFDEMLQKLPAMGFTSFEIWTVVPAEFAGYDYVINILPDPTQRLFGVVGANEASYTANDGSFSFRQGVTGSANKLRFNGGLTFRNANAPKYISESSVLFYPTATRGDSLVTQRSEKRSSGERYGGNLRMSYDLSKRQFITLGIAGSTEDGRSRSNILTENLMEGVNTVSNKRNTLTSDARSLEADATYQLNFKKQSRYLNLSYLFRSSPTSSDERQSTIFESGVGKDSVKLVTSNVKNITQRVQLDYNDSYLNGKFSFSTRVGYLKMDYDKQNSIFNELTQEEVGNAYTRLQQNLDRFDGYAYARWSPSARLTFNSSVRADYIPRNKNNATEFTTGDHVESVYQKDLLLSASGGVRFLFNIKRPAPKKPNSTSGWMGASAGNSSINLSYNYDEARPAIELLTNYSDTENSLYIKRGNPHLEAEATHSFRMDFQPWFMVSPSFTYTFSNNRIVPQTVSETDADGNARLVTTYSNAGKFRSTIINIFHQPMPVRSPKPVRFGLGMSNVNYIHQKTVYGDGTVNKLNYYSLSTSSNLYVRNFNANMQLSYRLMEYNGVGGGKSEYPLSLSFNFSMKHKIGPNKNTLGYTVRVSDVFTWGGDKRRLTTNMPDFLRTEYTNQRIIPVSFSINYNYGKFKVKPLRSSMNRATVDGFSTGAKPVE